MYDFICHSCKYGSSYPADICRGSKALRLRGSACMYKFINFATPRR